MASKVFSGVIVGLEAQCVEVEADVSPGLPRFNIVGLPDKAVEESKERVSSAIKSVGFKSPFQNNHQVVINLAPADLKKEGSIYDLPIALAYLLASGQLRFDPQKTLFVGELSLDGRLRPIRGAISFALLAKEKNLSYLVLPKANAAQAAIIDKKSRKLKVIAAESLSQVIGYLETPSLLAPFQFEENQERSESSPSFDLSWIKGQYYAKRALEIAAAGGHNLMFIGPPGTGKSLLAKALSSILPPLSFEDALEVTKIYSVAGLLPKETTLITQPPFRSPHHTASEAALIGGGSPPRPGEITLAHRGVLFLDEWPEFHRDVLESLRQPLEEGRITILRARHQLTFPAKFMLVAAANPCPCGYKDNPEKACCCSPSQVAKYQRKLSGPLMDRLDLFVYVPRVEYEKLVTQETTGTSEQLREKIKKARQIQQARFLDSMTNSEMDLLQIKKYCQLNSHCQLILRQCVESHKLSARGYHRVLKIARTIADLEGSESILEEHLKEAIKFRVPEEGS